MFKDADFHNKMRDILEIVFFPEYQYCIFHLAMLHVIICSLKLFDNILYFQYQL